MNVNANLHNILRENTIDTNGKVYPSRNVVYYTMTNFQFPLLRAKGILLLLSILLESTWNWQNNRTCPKDKLNTSFFNLNKIRRIRGEQHNGKKPGNFIFARALYFLHFNLVCGDF